LRYISTAQPCPTSIQAYPNGQFDALVVFESDFLLEVAGVDGGLLVVVELVVDELERNGCFAHSSLAEHHNLENRNIHFLINIFILILITP